MKRVIAIVMLIIIMLSNILPSYVYAEEKEKRISDESFDDVNQAYTVDSYNSINDDGSAQLKSNSQNSNYTNLAYSRGLFQNIVVYIVAVVDVLPVVSHKLITVMTDDGYEAEKTDNDSGNDQKYFTIESLVKNDRPLFDANYFKIDDSKSTTNKKMKELVATWFYAIRNVALIISLAVLIYIGIRMAISSIATDKAYYKKMLIGWFEGFILIFLMPYILAVAFGLLEVINEFIKSSVSAEGGFEEVIIKNFGTYFVSDVSYKFILWSVAYWALVLYQLRFLIAYAKRFLSIGFLIMISPLVSVTYAIDKVKDGRAQGMGLLLKELMVNIFIQPIHILIFDIFIIVANNIAEQAPIIAIAFLFALSRVEKIVKTVFNMRGLTSIHSVGHFMPIRKAKK